MDAWWHGAVIYSVYPRSFMDSNGDGIGDIPGLIAKLDYIAALGIDAIWLAPVSTSPMRDFGYDVSNFTDIDPSFGDLGDFDALLARAHDLDIKIILDQVYSHTSSDHPWFRESRADRNSARADWYVWADPKPDGSPPNNWLAVFGGSAWTWDSGRAQYYLHNFLIEQPDLNMHNEDVQAEILKAMQFWLERGVDGFRLDSPNFFMHDPLLRDNPPAKVERPVKAYQMQDHIYDRGRPENMAFIAQLRALSDRYDKRLLLAELSDERPFEAMKEYTGHNDTFHTGYNYLLLGEGFDAARIRASVEKMFNTLGPDAWPTWAFSTHDVVRVASRWTPKGLPGQWTQTLLAFLTSLRGPVLLYQGEELGLTQTEMTKNEVQDPEGKAFWPLRKGRDGERTPMPWQKNSPHAGFTTGTPWLRADPAHRVLAVDVQSQDDQSMLSFARNWLGWRERHPALVKGSTKFCDSPEGTLCIVREVASERCYVFVNLSDTHISMPQPFAGEASDVFAFGGALESGSVHLPAGAGIAVVAPCVADFGPQYSSAY